VDGDEDDGQPNAAVAVMRAASTTVRPPRTGPGREGALMAPEPCRVQWMKPTEMATCTQNTVVATHMPGGYPKGATNGCECFPSFHWSDGGRTRPTRTAKNGSANGGPPKQRTGPAENTEPATVQNRCVLGVPQRGHKRM